MGKLTRTTLALGDLGWGRFKTGLIHFKEYSVVITFKMQTISVHKEIEKWGPLAIAGGSVKWCI